MSAAAIGLQAIRLARVLSPNLKLCISYLDPLYVLVSACVKFRVAEGVPAPRGKR
jgi:hypothetical protein